MSSEVITEQRRISLRTTQVHAELRVMADELRGLEGTRIKAQKTFLEQKHCFNRVKQELTRALGKSVDPKIDLQQAANALRLLREKRREVTAAGGTLDELDKRKSEIVYELQSQRRQVERLDEKSKTLQRKTNAERERLEIEFCTENRIAGIQGRGRLDAMPSENTSCQSLPHSLPNEGMASGCAAQTSPSLTPYSGHIADLQTSDNLGRSSVALTFSDRTGERLDLELIRRGERLLDVRVSPVGQGDRRSLWRARENILRALAQAGYTVERFFFGMGK